MNRITEFTPTQEAAVVSRVLVMVHKAVDENFPSAMKANRQFTKTVFSESESTAIDRIPGLSTQHHDHEGHEGAQPGKHPSTDPSSETPGGDGRPPNYVTHFDPIRSGLESKVAKEFGEGRRVEEFEGKDRGGSDWVLRITVAALIAGVILLFYVWIL